MQNLPSVKTHPVLVPVIAVVTMLVYGIACATGGFWLRIMLESRAELAVVLDDSDFYQEIILTAQELAKDYNSWMEGFYRENTSVPECLSNPMPKYYHDNDIELYPDKQ